MRFQPKEVLVNNFLSWESARLDEYVQDLECSAPVKTFNHLPAWFKELKNNLQNYGANTTRYNNTARACAGFRSLIMNTYTIPMPLEYNGEENVICRKVLQPEMLHGTIYAKRTESIHDWDFALIAFPWRARLAKGFAIQVQEHGLIWSNDLKVFTGILPPNHNPNKVKNGFGNLYTWEQIPDVDNYNYCNIEIVIAHKKNFRLSINDVFCSISIVKISG